MFQFGLHFNVMLWNLVLYCCLCLEVKIRIPISFIIYWLADSRVYPCSFPWQGMLCPRAAFEQWKWSPTSRSITCKASVYVYISSLLVYHELIVDLHSSCLPIFYALQLDRLRPEFRSSLDELTRYVFGRTRPKQVGSTVMTGPVLAAITQSFLDALNSGAVPTISSSWQVSLL